MDFIGDYIDQIQISIRAGSLGLDVAVDQTDESAAANVPQRSRE